MSNDDSTDDPGASGPQPKSFPSLTTQAKNLSSTAFDALRATMGGQQVRAQSEEFDRRLQICFECDSYEAESIRCRECGCHLKAKARLSVAKCPLEKW